MTIHTQNNRRKKTRTPTIETRTYTMCTPGWWASHTEHTYVHTNHQPNIIFFAYIMNNQFKSFIELDMSHHTPGANTHSTHQIYQFWWNKKQRAKSNNNNNLKKGNVFLFSHFDFSIVWPIAFNNGTLGAHTLKSIPKHLSFFLSLSLFATIFFSFQFPISERTEKIWNREKEIDFNIYKCDSGVPSKSRECASNQL